MERVFQATQPLFGPSYWTLAFDLGLLAAVGSRLGPTAEGSHYVSHYRFRTSEWLSCNLVDDIREIPFTQPFPWCQISLVKSEETTTTTHFEDIRLAYNLCFATQMARCVTE